MRTDTEKALNSIAISMQNLDKGMRALINSLEKLNQSLKEKIDGQEEGESSGDPLS